MTDPSAPAPGPVGEPPPGTPPARPPRLARRAATRPAGPPSSPSPQGAGSDPASPGRPPSAIKPGPEADDKAHTTGPPALPTTNQQSSGRSLRRRHRQGGRTAEAVAGSDIADPVDAPAQWSTVESDDRVGAASEDGEDTAPLPGDARRGVPPGGRRVARGAAGDEGSPSARDEARPTRRRVPRADAASERLLRALVSTRPTQLPPTVAMRAREVGAPTPEDMARAEQEVVIIRRNYVPPAPLTTARRPPRAKGQGAQGSPTDQNSRGQNEPVRPE
jgi:hypothetical protein